MNDSVFGEIKQDEYGLWVNRKFHFFDAFLPSDLDLDEENDEIRSGLMDQYGAEVGELLDTPIDELDPENLPESVVNSPLGFLIKHGERLQKALEGMVGDDDDDEQTAAEIAEEMRLMAEGILSVSIEMLGHDEPTDAQRAAYQYLADHEEEISSSVIDGIFDYYQFVRDEDPNWFEDADCPAIVLVSDLAGLIEISGAVVTPFEYDGVALIGFRFTCDWDPEHGLGVLVHRDRVIEVGSEESAYEPHAKSVWQRIRPGIAKLANKLIASAEAAQDQAFEALSPTEKLTHALLDFDDEKIQELLAAGADINGAEYPALFVAIDQPSAELVRAILDLGGSPYVEFEGETALDYAELALESVTQANLLFQNLGDDLLQELKGLQASFFDDAIEQSLTLGTIVELLANAADD